jgi:hypothetical protein
MGLRGRGRRLDIGMEWLCLSEEMESLLCEFDSGLRSTDSLKTSRAIQMRSASYKLHTVSHIALPFASAPSAPNFLAP